MARQAVMINRYEAEEILESFDTLEREFAGCIPIQGECKGEYNHLSIHCAICEKLRGLLGIERREE